MGSELVMKRFLYYIIIFQVISFISCDKEDNSVLRNLNSGNYVIAHRGMSRDVGLPENSRGAFKLALESNIYAVEFDVQQTSDGILIINHDYYYNNKLIRETSYKELIKDKLSNGEILPTLEDFLMIYNEVETNVGLFIEIKQCDISSLVDIVNKYNVTNVKYTSFSLSYLDLLVNIGQGNKAIYVGGDLTPNEIKNRGYGGIAYNISVFDSHIDWVDQSFSLGLETCVWTVDAFKDIKRYAEMGVKVYTNRAWLCTQTN